jgi:hypothetical protein
MYQQGFAVSSAKASSFPIQEHSRLPLLMTKSLGSSKFLWECDQLSCFAVYYPHAAHGPLSPSQ